MPIETGDSHGADESQIVQFIQTEASHGLEHAKQTAELTGAIAREPEYAGKIIPDERIMLQHAGLLHDVGYRDPKAYWTGTQEEHPFESALAALDVLKNIEFYRDRPERLGQVLWLTYNHDNTDYTFPAFWLFEQQYLARKAPSIAIPRLLPGTTRSLPVLFEKALGKANVPGAVAIDDHLIDLLQILQEADSRLGDAQRTLAFCDKRGVPRFANDGGVIGVGSLWWQGSAAANIILALNRALLDAHTKFGQQIAQKIYEDGFTFVRRLYDEKLSDPSYIRPEPGTETIAQLRPEDVTSIFRRTRRERWDNYGTHQVYIEYVRSLIGVGRDLQDRFGRHLYTIASRIVPMEQIQYDASQRHNEQSRESFTLKQVRDEVVKKYAMDPFTQLVGSMSIIVYEHDPVLHDEVTPYSLIPPVVCVDRLDAIGKPLYQLLIGADWVESARVAGLNETRVIFVQP